MEASLFLGPHSGYRLHRSSPGIIEKEGQMHTQPYSLLRIFEGWEGFNTSLVRAVEQTPPELFDYRAAPEMRSVGEIVRHLSLGRINWFHRMDAPGSSELVQRVPVWHTDAHGNRYVEESALTTTPSELLEWLNSTWSMIEQTLAEWTVDDLFRTYRHTYWGKTYLVSHQWTIWRIMAHDIYHGGQLTILLGSQGVSLPELADQGGHLTELPLADSD